MTVAQTLEQVMAQWGKSHEPIVKPELVRVRMGKGYSRWRMQLVEVWPNDDIRIGNGPLDKRVEWTCQTLESWKTANRTAWDMWMFDSKREAEKFVTIYNLKWA